MKYLKNQTKTEAANFCAMDLLYRMDINVWDEGDWSITDVERFHSIFIVSMRPQSYNSSALDYILQLMQAAEVSEHHTFEDLSAYYQFAEIIMKYCKKVGLMSDMQKALACMNFMQDKLQKFSDEEEGS